MATRNLVKLRATQRRYRDKHRDERNAKKRADYRTSPEKHRVRTKRYRDANREAIYAYNREWSLGYRAELRAELITAYGGACSCCDERTPQFLQLDHINNDGAAERRRENANGVGFFARLKRRGWPKDRYRLLCANCNFGRLLNGGVCPHQQ
jgi:hypothetical protein